MMTPDPTSDPATDPAHADQPAEINGYRIQRVLGAGGMATVYAALQARPRRTVALKVIRPDAVSTRTRRRFSQEMEILGRLRHPFIAAIYEGGTFIDQRGVELPYFAMEYVPRAQPIIDHIEQQGLDVEARLRLVVKVCAAVEHGHRQRVVHLDLKPGNVLIDEAGQPKVIDFGIARVAASGASAVEEAGDPSKVRVVGTAPYMAPEQFAIGAADLDARCDVYALGVLLYRLLTGRLPHEVAGLPLHIARQMVRDEAPRPLASFDRRFAGDLDAIVGRAMAKSPGDRYRDAGALGRDVLRYLEHRPVRARPASLPRRAGLFVRRHRAAVAGIAVAVGVVLLAVGVLIIGRVRDARDDAQRAALAEQLAAAQADRQTAVSAARAAAQRAAKREMQTLNAHLAQVNDLAFSADGRLISAGRDGGIAFFTDHDGTWRESARLPAPHDEPLRMLAAPDAADGPLHAVTRSGRVLRIDGDVVQDLAAVPCAGIRADAPALAWLPDGRLATACHDFTVRVLDPDVRSQRVLRSTAGRVIALAADAAGERVAGATARGVVHVWSVNGGRITFQSDEFLPPPAHVVWRPGGDGLLVIDDLGDGFTIDIHPDSADQAAGERFAAFGGAPVALAYSADRRWLACASADTVTAWDLAAMERLLPLRRFDQRVIAVAIAPDGTWIAVGLLNGDVQLIPVE